jgi:O-antigen ligase/tetratricopeptide (TPR) repeat protein
MAFPVKSRAVRSKRVGELPGSVHFSIIALTLLGACLGGTAERWSQGTLLVLVSLLVLVRPPRRRPDRTILVTLAGLIGLILLGFAPAQWVPVPQWRTEFSTLGVSLPNAFSPQPWLTLEGLLLFSGAALWACWLNAQEWSPSARASLIGSFGAGVVLFAAVALALYSWKANPPFWFAPRGFGPFLNRNHTSNFLALGGIVALVCAHDRWRDGRATWVFWIVGWATILAALIVNYSRAGIVLLLGGAAVWLAMVCWFSQSRRQIAIGLSVVVVMLSLFLLLGGDTLARFKTEFGPEQGLLGFRGLVFRDTLSMISDSPWLGVGLTNFRPIFPFFRQASVVEATVGHPESDWLWVAAELGWPGVVLLAVGFLFLLGRALPFRGNTERHLRAGAWVAAIAFAVHGFVDVAGHRLAAALPALFLISVAASANHSRAEGGTPSSERSMQPSISRWTPWLFRCAALPVLVAGGLWVWASWSQFPLPGAIGVALAKRAAPNLLADGQFDEAIRRTSEALEWAPLDWRLNWERGAARAYAGQWIAAIGDFRRARRLQPHLPGVPLEEGQVWLRVQPMFALPAWQDALQRASPTTAPNLYARMLAMAPADPRFRARLRAMSDGRLPLQLIYLRHAAPEEISEIIRGIRGTDPELATLRNDQKTMLFDAWSRSPERAEFLALLEQNTGWHTAGWRHLARHYAAQDDFARACQLAFSHLPMPPVPQPGTSRDSLHELRRRTLTNPADFASAYALYLAELQEARPDDALATLDRTNIQPNRPVYFLYLTAKLRAERGEWPAAWTALTPLVNL